MTAPCENGDVQEFQLLAGGTLDDKTYLDCLIQKSEGGETVVQTMGSIDHKITIQATDEVYETTKLRATQLEKERKEARAKEIQVATTSKIKLSNHKPSLETHRTNLHTDAHRSTFETHRPERSTLEAHRTNLEAHRANLETHRTNPETHKPKVPFLRNPTPPVLVQESVNNVGSLEDYHLHPAILTPPNTSESNLHPTDHTDTESEIGHRVSKSRHHAIAAASTSGKDRQASPVPLTEKPSNTFPFSDSKENASSYTRDYPALTNVQQRSEYKLVFNKEYKLYLSLKQAFDEVQIEVNDLSKQYRNCEDKRKAKIIKRRVKQKYFEVQNDSSYRDRRQQLLYLHSKLEHIKKMVTDYDGLQ